MPKIVGIERKNFTTKDGTAISGATFHITLPIPPDKGEGVAGDSFFLSTAKLEAQTFTPVVGQEIEVLYNKYGKPAKLALLAPADGNEVIDL